MNLFRYYYKGGTTAGIGVMRAEGRVMGAGIVDNNKALIDKTF